MKGENSLTADEEKAMIGLLYNHVSFITTLECNGELGPEGLKRAETLRGILGKLLEKYDLIPTLSAENLLLLGLTSLIEDGYMDDFTSSPNQHLKKRADYFLKKEKNEKK